MLGDLYHSSEMRDHMFSETNTEWWYFHFSASSIKYLHLLYFQAHPKYLSCIATCCFYIAIRSAEANSVFIPCAAELIKLSQCGGTSSELSRMELLILDKLQWQLDAITPLTFLQLFHEVLGIQLHLKEPNALNLLIGKLEVLMCNFEFTKFRVCWFIYAVVSFLNSVFLRPLFDGQVSILSLLVSLDELMFSILFARWRHWL